MERRQAGREERSRNSEGERRSEDVDLCTGRRRGDENRTKSTAECLADFTMTKTITETKTLT